MEELNIVKKGASYECKLSRKFIFEKWCTEAGGNAEKIKIIFDILKFKIEREGYIVGAKYLGQLEKRVHYCCKSISIFWRKCCRNRSNVLRKHSDWLATNESFFFNCDVQIPENNIERGRPKLDFSECSRRTKRRRIAEIAGMDESAADCLRFATEVNSTKISPASATEVISLMMETNLTKHQYLVIREFVNTKISAELFCSYDNILKAKKETYPENVTVSESHAEVELQSLLDHTTKRIIELQDTVVKDVFTDPVNNLKLIGKWGFDGSSGYSEYKQKVENKNLEDSHMFVTSYVPLVLLTTEDSSNSSKIIWKNPRPSSTRYCRPVRFQFKKESTELSTEEEKYFKKKIEGLVPTKIIVGNKTLCVQHILQLTMVDGKICNALTQTSSSKCYICNAKPTDMNNIEKCLKREVQKDRFEFGLSPLHAYIRFFEYFLHLSYKLKVQVWQARSLEAKAQVKERKNKIQTEFRLKMGLIVDKPKSGGSGTSNDGNTAREFFNNAGLSAQITGLDRDLIERCATILQVLNSGYNINVGKFNSFALDIAKKLTTTYFWYYLPATVHKVLIHGPAIVECALVSIGELSEEAAESRNKDIKKFRLHHTRKISRVATNEDLLNRLLLTSDPFITGQRKLPPKHKSVLNKSVFDLLE